MYQTLELNATYIADQNVSKIGVESNLLLIKMYKKLELECAYAIFHISIFDPIFDTFPLYSKKIGTLVLEYSGIGARRFIYMPIWNVSKIGARMYICIFEMYQKLELNVSTVGVECMNYRSWMYQKLELECTYAYLKCIKTWG